VEMDVGACEAAQKTFSSVRSKTFEEKSQMLTVCGAHPLIEVVHFGVLIMELRVLLVDNEDGVI